MYLFARQYAHTSHAKSSLPMQNLLPNSPFQMNIHQVKANLLSHSKMQPVIIQTPNINIYLKFNCQQEKILPTKNSRLTVWNLTYT